MREQWLLTRRAWLQAAAAAPLGAVLAAQGRHITPPQISTPGRPDATDKFGPSVDAIPIVDAHIHLFDGTRPQGASYMGSAAYRAKSQVSLPDMYAPIAKRAGIIGAIIVESSAWVEDNLWYLEVAEKNPIIVGVCGRLDPYKPEFGEYLERYHRNPLYRAIRASRFFTTTNGKVTLDRVAVDNLKLLADAGLAQDTANPSMELMTANVLLADAIPSARIIMDHVPEFDPPPGGDKAFEDIVKEMAARPNIYAKLSGVYHPNGPTEYSALRDRLEMIYGYFGQDRVIFGSDYPNSYGVATISEEVGLMKEFFAAKTRQEAEKYFWRNAVRCYNLPHTTTALRKVMP